jgi:hypothetical protein
MPFFIATAVKTSNLTFFYIFRILNTVFPFIYRGRTNYWTISSDKISSWNCAMILKWLLIATQLSKIWNGLNSAKAISQENHTLFYDKRLPF